jgi:mitochondrial fission protein ELM1
MPLEIDSANKTCSAALDGAMLSSPTADVVIITNDRTHMSEALIEGKPVPITEAEADALTVYGADDQRHNTVARGGAI